MSEVLCDCGHERNYHGNADGQTGWQARCGHPDCECEDFERDYCGCCGNEIDGDLADWCDRCNEHVGRWPGYAWDRTYFAIHGVDCPFQVERKQL